MVKVELYLEIKTISKLNLIRNKFVQFFEEMNALCMERVHTTFANIVTKRYNR